MTEWFFAVSIERVFVVLEAAEDWPSFWKGVQRVEVLHRPAQGRVGMKTRTTWKSALPYALTFDAEVIAFDAPRLIEVRAEGQLKGVGRWELREVSGGTWVTYQWNVATTQTWMNWLAPMLKPLFRWNHDVVMQRGYEGLCQRLGSMPARW